MKRSRTLRSIPFDVSLRDALGERLRVLPDDCAKFPVSGRDPKAVAFPRNESEAALALAAAADEGAVVAIRGAGTKSHRPPTPRVIDVVIDTGALAGVEEHASEDLTVTVAAGTTLAQLAAALARKGQFWPCDAPHAAAATVGGTIAANANGALRLRYGPIRELVLGTRIATPEGKIVRAGSRVVKSVAGYDAHKLMAGSFGTLGLIVETTLKVAPIPEVENIVVARFRSPVTASAIARSVAGSVLFPMAIVLLDDAASRRVGSLLVHAAVGEWLLLVRCGGNRASVVRQTSDIVSGCAAAGADETAVIDRTAVERTWIEVRELCGGAPYAPDRFAVVKIASLPTDVPVVLGDARDRWPSAELTAQPATGLVFAHVPVRPQGEVVLDGHVAASAFADSCVRSGWTAVTISAPPSWRATPPYVADRAAPVRLYRAVKASLDPFGTLDPGRLPGGV